ncbi:fungal-specific transcription factor domain-containing protein [Microdochium trichocladiopsis]|uniref:Fungal-specific transcription factor domain-containing protein n=1 Tax=Microdochium trichocladiopsis TaxID=1682393 RepID=A0A9P8XV11_9PEZI|nr:fungal-specific transcription factor domain-containing protein [Microdochium trichocladiopsis]KAH7020690.1 fungal-specific transcription factor domain-containing protein [Microdochium trichocladiopsis]
MAQRQKKTSHSIDTREGFHGTYFGLSGEVDPYLLRHYLYDDADEFTFLRLIYRQLHNDLHDPTAPPSPQRRPLGKHQGQREPVQFYLMSSELADEHKQAGPKQNPRCEGSTAGELDALVDHDQALRLLQLFITYVFPAMPVISRSQLLSSMASCNGATTITPSRTMPIHLLAAIYASALPFWSYDDVLCVSSVYKKPSSETLWQIAYDGFQAEILTPHLATVATGLLYLNKARQGVQHVSADITLTWTLLSSIVGIATSLALHIDCSHWAIPGWEKRLRRRLWWMTFSEEEWRSLLLGRPSIINEDQWDVEELSVEDFALDSEGVDAVTATATGNLADARFCLTADSEAPHCILSQMAKLACIAGNIHRSLYTIRATRRVAHDIEASMATVRPLRAELVCWYSQLPSQLRLQSRSCGDGDRSTPASPNSAACFRFAYLTLEVLLYRALLRPLGSLDLEHDGDEDMNDVDTSSGLQDDHVGVMPLPQMSRSKVALEAAEAIISAAEKCAGLVIDFAAMLMSWDFAGFSYSWLRIGWATSSSFFALLLVQSPSLSHAQTCKGMMDRWRQVLRHQSKSFEDMRLGILRLDAMYWSDMRKIFRVNRHAARVLGGTDSVQRGSGSHRTLP